MTLDLVIDPVLFAPPEGDDPKPWVVKLIELRSFIERSCLRVSCADEVRDMAIALWYSQPDPKGGPSAHELARMAHESASRLKNSPHFAAGVPLLDGISVDPAYVNRRIDPNGRTQFEDHLAEAACVKNDGGTHLGVLGPVDSWSRETDAIEIEAEILGRDHELDGLTEAEGIAGRLREFLARSDTIKRVLEVCCEHPCSLLATPEFGVRALWAVHFGGDPWEIDFEVGPQFNDSVKSMNYQHRPGDAKRCLRVMAQIAGGRADQVDGHEERETAAPTSPIQVDKTGNSVIRSRLQNKVADAHRLFWARGPKPIFLNVSGHQGGPAI